MAPSKHLVYNDLQGPRSWGWKFIPSSATRWENGEVVDSPSLPFNLRLVKQRKLNKLCRVLYLGSLIKLHGVLYLGSIIKLREVLYLESIWPFMELFMLRLSLGDRVQRYIDKTTRDETGRDAPVRSNRAIRCHNSLKLSRLVLWGQQQREISG